MKKTTVILLGALFFTGVGIAGQSKQQQLASTSVSKAGDENAVSDLKLAQQKLDFFKERLDFQDKRIGDISLYLSVFGALMTVVVVFFSLRSKREAVLEAKEEAKKEAREEVERQAKTIIETWLNNDGRKVLTAKVEDLLRPEVDKALQEIKQAAASTLAELEKEREKAHDHNMQWEQFVSSVQSKKPPPLSSDQKQQMAETAKDLQSKPPKQYKFGDWFMLGVQAFDAAKYEISAEHFAKAAEIADHPQHQAIALVNRGIALGQMNRNEEAIAIYTEVERHFGNTMEIDLRRQVARALLSKGVALGSMDRGKEEISAYDEVVSRFGTAREMEPLEQVAMALVNKGVALGKMNRSDEEIDVYDEVVKRFGDSSESALWDPVASALVNKGIALGKMNRGEEEIVAYEKVIRRFGDVPESALQEQVAKAMANKGFRLSEMNRNEEAIAVFDEMAKHFSDVPERVASAIVNKGIALGKMNRGEEAMVAYEEVVKRFGDSPEIKLREQVMKALVNMGFMLGEMNRDEEAIAVYDGVVKRFDDAQESILLEGVATALNGHGFGLICEAKKVWREKNDEAGANKLLVQALEKIDAALERKPNDPFFLGNRGYILFLRGVVEDARSILVRAFELGGEEVRKAELKDADIFPLPQDEAFKALIKSL